MVGIVKFFNKDKGYGFVKAEDGEEYFMHVSGINSKEIVEQDRVEFDLKEGKKGMNACNIEKL